jgi:hypothetical protein
MSFYPSRIPEPGVKKAPDPGSGSATLDTGIESLSSLLAFTLYKRVEDSEIDYRVPVNYLLLFTMIC